MKMFFSVLAALLVVSVASSCNAASTTQPTENPTASATPDSCSSRFLPAEVDKIHKLMREFDDASLLASNTPRDQLPPVISDMQRIRRSAEDQFVPPCLGTLKQLQLIHMNTVIDTLIAFLSGADQTTLNQGTEISSRQYNAYALEYARVLGLTVVAPPTPTPDMSVTETPPPSTPEILAAQNPGPQELNMYFEPSVDSTIVAVLFVHESARVVGESPDGQWIQVEIPNQAGQFAWVSVSSVELLPLAP